MLKIFERYFLILLFSSLTPWKESFVFPLCLSLLLYVFKQTKYSMNKEEILFRSIKDLNDEITDLKLKIFNQEKEVKETFKKIDFSIKFNNQTKH